jgi:hypothetical protein
MDGAAREDEKGEHEATDKTGFLSHFVVPNKLKKQ